MNTTKDNAAVTQKQLENSQALMAISVFLTLMMVILVFIQSHNRDNAMENQIAELKVAIEARKGNE